MKRPVYNIYIYIYIYISNIHVKQFPIINFWNPGVHYETPCISKQHCLTTYSANQSAVFRTNSDDSPSVCLIQLCDCGMEQLNDHTGFPQRAPTVSTCIKLPNCEQPFTLTHVSDHVELKSRVHACLTHPHRSRQANTCPAKDHCNKTHLPTETNGRTGPPWMTERHFYTPSRNGPDSLRHKPHKPSGCT